MVPRLPRPQFTPEQRSFCVNLSLPLKDKKLVFNTIKKKFSVRYPGVRVPSRDAIKNFVKKFETKV